MPEKTNNAKSFDSLLLLLCAVLGLLAFGVFLAYHNIADGDLWARLSAGAIVWETGSVAKTDPFGFTERLPLWIDHEWGAGLIFYSVLKAFGPGGLMALKALLAIGAVTVALLLGRHYERDWAVQLFLIVPCAAAVLPKYVPVIRSHTLTFFFFALTLYWLEKLHKGRHWPVPCLTALMLVWANSHGGFVAGLGMIGISMCFAFAERRNRTTLLVALTACTAITLLNPYGIRYWTYVLSAVTHPRTYIPEWNPTDLIGPSVHTGFRVLFVFIVIAVLLGFRNGSRKVGWRGNFILLLTACLAWQHRRHQPFFGLAAAAYAGPYVACAFARIAAIARARVGRALPAAWAVLALYTAIALFAVTCFLPRLSLEVLAPVGFYPVRETDILAQARVRGNLVCPFRWGSYAAWRLYPNIKVSIDGRYEETYPEKTFLLHQAFYQRWDNWDTLLRTYDVDFIMIDFRRTRLRLPELLERGYQLVFAWERSGLLAKPEWVQQLRKTAAQLPPTTINPLDPTIPQHWDL